MLTVPTLRLLAARSTVLEACKEHCWRNRSETQKFAFIIQIEWAWEVKRDYVNKCHVLDLFSFDWLFFALLQERCLLVTGPAWAGRVPVQAELCCAPLQLVWAEKDTAPAPTPSARHDRPDFLHTTAKKLKNWQITPFWDSHFLNSNRRLIFSESKGKHWLFKHSREARWIDFSFR